MNPLVNTQKNNHLGRVLKVISIIGFLFVLEACQHKSKTPSTAVAPVDPPKAEPEVKLSPEREAAANDFLAICEKKSRLKDKEESKLVCACIVRNHVSKLELPEVKILIQRYRSGSRNASAPPLKRVAPASEAETMLWEYDQGVASECAQNPGYRVPEVH